MLPGNHILFCIRGIVGNLVQVETVGVVAARLRRTWIILTYHWRLRRKCEQYFVVPKDADTTRPFILRPSTLVIDDINAADEPRPRTAAAASSFRAKVTYAPTVGAGPEL
jgi:hypothetical protein